MAKFQIVKDDINPPLYYAQKDDFGTWCTVRGTYSFSEKETEFLLRKELCRESVFVKELEL